MNHFDQLRKEDIAAAIKSFGSPVYVMPSNSAFRLITMMNGKTEIAENPYNNIGMLFENAQKVLISLQHFTCERPDDGLILHHNLGCSHVMNYLIGSLGSTRHMALRSSKKLQIDYSLCDWTEQIGPRHTLRTTEVKIENIHAQLALYDFDDTKFMAAGTLNSRDDLITHFDQLTLLSP